MSAGTKLKAIFVLLLLAASGSLWTVRLAHTWMSRALLIILALYFLAPPAMIYGTRIKLWLRRKRGLCLMCGTKLDGLPLTCSRCDAKIRADERGQNWISS